MIYNIFVLVLFGEYIWNHSWKIGSNTELDMINCLYTLYPLIVIILSLSLSHIYLIINYNLAWCAFYACQITVCMLMFLLRDMQLFHKYLIVYYQFLYLLEKGFQSGLSSQPLFRVPAQIYSLHCTYVDCRFDFYTVSHDSACFSRPISLYPQTFCYLQAPTCPFTVTFVV